MRNAWTAESPESHASPTTCPEALMPHAWLVVPPSVPRSVATPPCQRTACVDPSTVAAEPTTWPEALMAAASLYQPPSVSRFVTEYVLGTQRSSSGSTPGRRDSDCRRGFR